MALTFAQLRSRVLSWMDDSGNTGNLKTAVENSLNDANAQRATEYDWRFMIAPTPSTFSCTTSTSYTLSTSVSKPLYFYNRTKSNFITIVPERHIIPEDLNSTQFVTDVNQRAVLRGENQTLQFLRAPQSGDVIEYGYYVLPTEMSADGDYPDIPYPHSLLLVWDTLINLKAYTLEPDAIAIWQDNQQKALTSLYSAYGDSMDILGAVAENVHDLG